MTKNTAASILEKIYQCGVRPDGMYDGRRRTVIHLTKIESNQLYGLLDYIAGDEDYAGANGNSEWSAVRFVGEKE